MKPFRSLILAFAALLAASCIENDIPYPDVQVSISSLEGEGFEVAGIDIAHRTVTLRLDEQTDIRDVRIDRAVYDVAIRNTTLDRETLIAKIVPSTPLTGRFDLRTPLYVTLSLYADYEWTIAAEQPMTRRFAVAGQVGASEFDTENRIATAYVAKNADLSQVTVLDLKLGADRITEYQPAVADLSGSFESVRFVDVTSHGRTERWQLFVRHTDRSVSLDAADAWSRVLWLYGSGVEGNALGFRYREQGSQAWIEVPDVTVDGGSFRARLKVREETSYEVKAFCGDEESEPVAVTTDPVRQLPNGGMEEWEKPAKPWLPYLAANGAFWDSGNHGSTTLGEKDNVTVPYGDKYGVASGPLRPGTTGRTAAQLESRKVAGVKLAAGNLFTGEFAAIRGGTHGIINFGRPFTLRPTALKVWVRYQPGLITDVNAKNPTPEPVQVGDPDTGTVYIALGTWTKEKYGYGKDHEELFGTDECPVSVDTRDVRTFLNLKDEAVVGYGQVILREATDGWVELTIPIDYRTTDLKPTHLLIVCSASRWGDYFTGSSKSCMWVDDFELVYE